MKYYFLAIIAVLAVTMCVAETPQAPAPAPDIGSSAPPAQTQPTITQTYCGVAVELISPSRNERVSGGFRVEWKLVNSSRDFTNQYANFTIYMRPVNGETADLKVIRRFYGEIYKEDITFLNPVAKGNYVVGVRGKINDCTIHEGEIDVTV